MGERILSFLGVMVAGCTLLTEPASEERSQGSTATPGDVQDVPARSDSGSSPKTPPAHPREAPPRQLGGVSHILVSYAGAARSRVTRSKEEARQRARDLLERLRNGAEFGRLATEFSDDSTSRVNRGSLEVPAGTWVEPFARAAAGLAPGSISDLVETPFGFHIIKRDK